MGLADLNRFLAVGRPQGGLAALDAFLAESAPAPPPPAQGGGLPALESFLAESAPPVPPAPTPTPPGPQVFPTTGFEEFEPGPVLPSPTSAAGRAIQPVVQAVAPLVRLPVEAARRTLEIEPAVRAGVQEAIRFQRGEPIEQHLARRFMGLLRAASGFFEPLRSETLGQEIVAPAAEVLGAERLRPGIEAVRERLGTGPLGRRVSEVIGEVGAEAPAIALPAVAQARAFARPPRPPAVVRPQLPDLRKRLPERPPEPEPGLAPRPTPPAPTPAAATGVLNRLSDAELNRVRGGLLDRFAENARTVNEGGVAVDLVEMETSAGRVEGRLQALIGQVEEEVGRRTARPPVAEPTRVEPTLEGVPRATPQVPPEGPPSPISAVDRAFRRLRQRFGENAAPEDFPDAFVALVREEEAKLAARGVPQEPAFPPPPAEPGPPGARPPELPQEPRLPAVEAPTPRLPREVQPSPPPSAEAPVPAAPQPRAAGFQGGRAHRVITERGTEVDTQFALAEAGDLIPSHDTALRPNPRYPSSLQPRARERVASEIQLQKFEEGLIPSTLGESPKASKGAPIIGPDRVVESGNLRTIALQRLYERNHPNAQRYRDFLLRNAEEFGLDPRQIERMQRPVLVQVRRTPVDRVRFAQEANEGTAAAMSATEQARQDASRMSERLVNLLEPSESGELLTAGNREFFREFTREVVPPRELGRFLDAQGNISTEGVGRVRNALFARVFDDPTAVARLAEAADVNIRNIQNGILQALPRLARVKQGIQAGTLHDLDLAPAITEAANALSSARATGLAPQNVLRQATLFGEELSQAGRVVFQHFLEKSRSAKAIGETLKNYADLVENQGAPAQAGLFGGRVATVEELFQAAAGGRQAGLFAGAPSVPPSAGIPSAARISGEAGGAAITEPIVVPPSVQPPGPQVSTAIPPSGRATTRAITPSTRTGPVSTSGPVGAIEPTSKRIILQDTTDVNTLLRRATEAQPDFEASLRQVSEAVPGVRLVRTRVKEAVETTKKLNHITPETNGDYLGGRLAFDGRDEVDRIVAGLRERFEVLQVDDFLENPESRMGYRAVHVQVRLPNGLSAEVQLVPREVAPVQDVLHKEVYQKWRRRGVTSAERAEYEQDLARMRRDYDGAWASFEARTGRPAETAAPAPAAPEAGAPPPSRGPPAAPSGAAAPPPPEDARLLGQALPGAQAGPFSRSAERARGAVQQAIDQTDDLTRRARIALEQKEVVAREGTIPEPFKEPFFAPRAETLQVPLSQQEVKVLRANLVRAAREVERVRQETLAFGDTLAVNTAEAARRTLNQAADLFARAGTGAGRTLREFQMPADMRLALQEAGVQLERLRAGQVRLPLYTSIISKLRRVKDLTSSEWSQLGREVVDAWRLNLFSVTSWTLDLVGNFAEVGAQLTGGAARDIYTLGKGQLNFPSLQGWMRAVRERSRMRGQPLPAQIEERFGRTALGERIGGRFRGALTGAEPGTFTTRQTVGGRVVDLAVGSPLYAKGALDTAAKRLAGTASVWRDAIEEANRLGLRGMDRRQFYERYMRNLPEETVERAVAAGNKAGFNRELTRFEERIAGSTVFRVLGDVFARWPFQFTRTMGEWLGANPPLFRRIANGTVKGEEIAEYVGKTATGWGGLWLIEEGLYDRVDFNSMQYVHENGERTRLSGRDPIPTALWLLATVKGDVEKSTAALRFASLPFARLLVGEGGMLGSLVSNFVEASRNRAFNARGLQRNLTDMVNRAIPGQALLSALKSVFDPVLREGVGAQLPGVSLALPARVEPTTGKPLVPRQRIPGIPFEVPAIGGTPIPGARQVTEPVFNLLSRYGLLVYRGPRQPIAGVPAAEVPEDLRREWEEAFGKHRQRLLGPLARQGERLGGGDPERARKMIQARDAAAAKFATQEVNARAGAARRRLPRQPTVRERRGPAAFQEAR